MIICLWIITIVVVIKIIFKLKSCKNSTNLKI